MTDCWRTAGQNRSKELVSKATCSNLLIFSNFFDHIKTFNVVTQCCIRFFYNSIKLSKHTTSPCHVQCTLLVTILLRFFPSPPPFFWRPRLSFRGGKSQTQTLPIPRFRCLLLSRSHSGVTPPSPISFSAISLRMSPIRSQKPRSSKMCLSSSLVWFPLPRSLYH